MNCPQKYQLIKYIMGDLESVELYDENGEKVLVVLVDDWDGSTGGAHAEIRKENLNYEKEMVEWREYLAKLNEEVKKNRGKEA